MCISLEEKYNSANVGAIKIILLLVSASVETA